MGVNTDRLFHTLVLFGAGLAAGCAARPDTTERPSEPRIDPASPRSDAAAPQPHEPTAAPTADASDAGACECTGEGPTCEGNGVLCCWAQGECCEPCCPDPA